MKVNFSAVITSLLITSILSTAGAVVKVYVLEERVDNYILVLKEIKGDVKTLVNRDR